MSTTPGAFRPKAASGHPDDPSQERRLVDQRQRLYYNTLLYNCKEAATMFSMREIAVAVGVKTHQIAYAHLEGYLPEVQRVFGHRVYTETDLEMVRAYFAARPKAGRGISTGGQGGVR